MRPFRFAPLLAVVVLLSACAEDGRYPLSGEKCAPGDAVQGMTPPDCIPQ